jgi:hypothetical protein
MNAPRKGSIGTYDSGTKQDQFTVVSVEGNLCWAIYASDPATTLPFIWRFKDGLNIFHHWDGKP